MAGLSNIVFLHLERALYGPIRGRATRTPNSKLQIRGSSSTAPNWSDSNFFTPSIVPPLSEQTILKRVRAEGPDNFTGTGPGKAARQRGRIEIVNSDHYILQSLARSDDMDLLRKCRC